VIRTRRSVITVASVLAVSVVLAACGSSSGSKSDGGSGKTTSTTGGKAPSGTLVIGAEQDAACTDWINQCASSSWGAWMMQYQTMPRSFDYEKQGDDWVEVPSPLLAGMPTVSTVNGKQTVTYKISPNANWSDGTPITSSDYQYTWKQITTDKAVYDPTGYTQVESVDTTDPKTAVVTFKSPFASWTQMFNSDYGIMPSHLLEGKNRHNLMKNGYSWSGGPWKIEKWQKGVSVTLVPNTSYYGTKPTIQKVVFKILADTAAEFQAFRAGEVLAIYPQPEPSAISAIKGGVPGTNAKYSAITGAVEALWMNNSKFPLDSEAVRQAIGYSIDRDAIVGRLFGDIGVNKAWQTLNPPIVGRYADKTAFSQYTINLDKVNSLMTGDGWAKQNGVWTKNGKAAALTVQSTAGNKRRELIEQIIQAQLADAGFKLTIANKSADDLFGTILSAGTYQLSIYAQQATTPNPGLCSIACSSNIPTKENGGVGNNLSRINVPAADPLLASVDTNTNTDERIAASKQSDQLLGDAQVSLPIDPLPNVLLWSKQIGGPVDDNPILSMFWNMNAWTLQG
jgi:peptide/nickel transport system substrate-binding protein